MLVELVIPVYNEEAVLAQSVATVADFLRANLPYPWRIVIADNASTDGTLAIAQGLAQEQEGVRCLHIPQKGRGRALKAAWLASPADVVSYMDVDLSTELGHYPDLVRAIAEEGYDLATGSRLARGAQVRRSPRREALSRGYNLLVRVLFGVHFSDAQCGFKALSRRACQELVPLVEDGEWFFDTELLVLAERRGYRIKDLPVAWVEDPDSRVNVPRTAAQDLRGLWRLWRRPPP